MAQELREDYQPGEEILAENHNATNRAINALSREKQDAIDDLDDIRDGASRGATAIQEHQDISGKVDKVQGKGLSEQDFTAALKAKLEALRNYDDTELREAIEKMESAIDAISDIEGTTAIVESMTNVKAFLDSFSESENLSSVLADLEASIHDWVDQRILDKSKYITQEEYDALEATGDLDETIEYNIY